MKTNSLDAVYRTYINDLYQYLLRLSRSPQTAEDLVQDTFIKAYDYLDSYEGETIRPWLFRVAYNSYIDWYRKEHRQIQTDPAILANINISLEPSPEESLLQKERIAIWQKAVETLPESSRQVVILRDYYGFTYHEITYILGISLSNVKVKLFRARKKIKEEIKNDL